MSCTNEQKGANRIAGVYDFIEWLYEEGPNMEMMPRQELFNQYIEAVMKRNRPDDATVYLIRKHRQSPSLRDKVRRGGEPGVKLMADVVDIATYRKK